MFDSGCWSSACSSTMLPCLGACYGLKPLQTLKPQEKMFFKSPVETALQYFSHISQVWSFQKKQTDLLIAFYKHRITKLEAAIQEVQQTVTSQDKELSVLRKENEELKKFLAFLKESPSRYQGSRLTTPRPVCITSPSQSVTPRPSSQHSSQVVSRSSSVESLPYRVPGFGPVGQEGRILQGRSTPRDSNIETPSPASTHNLSYRTSSTPSGMGIFCVRPFLNGESGHTRVLTPNISGQRESRTPRESLPGFQLPVLQVNCLDPINSFISLLLKTAFQEDPFNSPSQPCKRTAPSAAQSPSAPQSVSCNEAASKATGTSSEDRSDVLPPGRSWILGTRGLHQTGVPKNEMLALSLPY
ncbi:RING finger protein 212B isoform X4 [Fukomys damarensis]|uniref:RING finger protein 212B isoform X4 n=1 Tax=Fukomys damarensis TaxID=885580 RepID=UPI00053FE4CD|nr:RING finger protein 212B isoform X4 [Fukomys damarensis]